MVMHSFMAEGPLSALRLPEPQAWARHSPGCAPGGCPPGSGMLSGSPSPVPSPSPSPSPDPARALRATESFSLWVRQASDSASSAGDGEGEGEGSSEPQGAGFQSSSLAGPSPSVSPFSLPLVLALNLQQVVAKRAAKGSTPDAPFSPGPVPSPASLEAEGGSSWEGQQKASLSHSPSASPSSSWQQPWGGPLKEWAWPPRLDSWPSGWGALSPTWTLEESSTPPSAQGSEGWGGPLGVFMVQLGRPWSSPVSSARLASEGGAAREAVWEAAFPSGEVGEEAGAGGTTLVASPREVLAVTRMATLVSAQQPLLASLCLLRLLDRAGRDLRGPRGGRGLEGQGMGSVVRSVEEAEVRQGQAAALAALLKVLGNYAANGQRCLSGSGAAARQEEGEEEAEEEGKGAARTGPEYSEGAQGEGKGEDERGQGSEGDAALSADALGQRGSRARCIRAAEWAEEAGPPAAAPFPDAPPSLLSMLRLAELASLTIADILLTSYGADWPGICRRVDERYVKGGGVGAGILALVLAAYISTLPTLQAEVLTGFAEQLLHLGFSEASFRVRLQLLAQTEAEESTFLQVVPIVYVERGYESVPDRVARLFSAVTSALARAPNHAARYAYAQRFSRALLALLEQDPPHPCALLLAQSYLRISGQLGPPGTAEADAAAAAHARLCARTISQQVLRGLPPEERSRGGGLATWIERTSDPGPSVGWLAWKSIGRMLEEEEPQHEALPLMWATAVRATYKFVNREGTGLANEALELFDWGLESILVARLSLRPVASACPTAEAAVLLAALAPAPADPLPERSGVLLAVAARMAACIYWRWGRRKETARLVAQLLKHVHDEGERRGWWRNCSSACMMRVRGEAGGATAQARA
eukprot:TRINITY_DN1207_c0_g1_i2.p1 TRINITY_DN1207_c0_g1~~TRINITY_DN1207_c0_g1_i2.p1  ORF type:complete len:875 (+),score=227.10 TRINITY_DN1207_c0_g1_i2:375-2999(+)